MSRRVVAFIDGFNLYHAVADLNANHLKWLNLRALCREFVPAPTFELLDVLFFTAYATWRKDSLARHQEYIAALKAARVTPIMGNFKEKDRACHRCKNRWKDHEEKETDVNVALWLFEYALDDRFDTALLLTGDSDISPAVRLIRRRFPGKEVRVLAPPGRMHSSELLRASGGGKHGVIKQTHLERCLLPPIISDSHGRPVANRPRQYDPPASFTFRPAAI